MTRHAWITAGAVTLALGAWLFGGFPRADESPGGSAATQLRPPGAAPLPPGLARQLRRALAAKGDDYEPRTHHLREDGSPKYVNRLILEKSPYLLQHAHNPVDWYPWGDEAFERARKEGKPVLLSIGYSTCHWCHVMERESFEDEEIAATLNEHYVAVKVDRERRPDVDGIYMAAVQTLTGSGGWPMTVWLTPDREPFFGGTYFPPRDGDRGTRYGFLTLLRRLHEHYRENPERVASTARELTTRIRKSLEAAPARPGGIADATLSAAADEAFFRLEASFDEAHGGFGGAPKFPRSVTLEFLLRYHHRTGTPKALAMVVKTLEAMAAGGIYDHVGGGFHRYSTDARWLVPHFEKMLYDNALLAVAYLEGAQAAGRDDFADVARDVLRYVAREMTAPGGGFHSATDADSEGEEGKFFVWTPKEIESVLGARRAKWFGELYGVTETGNFEHGTTILHVAAPLAGVAKRSGMAPEALREALGAARGELHAARAKRIPPLRDEKILVSWNGLMISAFARAAQALGEGDYARRAVEAAEFLLANLREGKRLRRTWYEGEADGTAYLDDYAFFAQGLLDLYEATFDPRWLREAIALHEVLEAHFLDRDRGGFFLTPDDAESLLAREKPGYDGAEPSGNSVAILNLLRLEELTTDDRYRVLADRALAASGSILERVPTAVPKMLAAAEFRLGSPKEVLLVKPSAETSAEPMLARLRATYLPNRVLVVAAVGDDLVEQKEVVPLLEGRTALHGELTAYVCENRVCDLPTRDPEVFERQIRERPPAGDASVSPPHRE